MIFWIGEIDCNYSLCLYMSHKKFLRLLFLFKASSKFDFCFLIITRERIKIFWKFKKWHIRPINIFTSGKYEIFLSKNKNLALEFWIQWLFTIFNQTGCKKSKYKFCYISKLSKSETKLFRYMRVMDMCPITWLTDLSVVKRKLDDCYLRSAVMNFVMKWSIRILLG